MKHQAHTTRSIYYSRVAPTIYALLNPAIFLFLWERGWLRTEYVGTNVNTLVLSNFILLSLLVYLIWNSLFFVIFRARTGVWDLQTFLVLSYRFDRFVILDLIPLGIGLINLLVWISGMEGNVFGFLFFPALGLGVIFQLIGMIIRLVRSLRYSTNGLR